MTFHSVFFELLDEHLEEKSKICSTNHVNGIRRSLVSFDAYCAGLRNNTEELTEELVGGWLLLQSDRSSVFQERCRWSIRQFAIHLLKNGRKAYVPPVRIPVTQLTGKAFESCLGESIRGLVEVKRTRGYKYGPMNEYKILKRLDSFCNGEGLRKDELPRWLVEKWSERFDKEGPKSRANRVTVIRQLAMYMASQGKEAYIAEPVPVPSNPFPRIPDEKEMAALLSEIDSQKTRHPWTDYTMPVLFRLLLASGMRVSEACSLKKCCVTFSCGNHCTIDILDAKGHKDRRIYMSGGVLELIEKYDRRMSFMFPDREWFFPSDYNPQAMHLPYITARKHFNIARDKVFGVGTSHKPTVHSLRHVFIIWTLRRWRNERVDIGKMLPYLSKHLGHSSIQETFTYYNHYERDFEHIKKDSGYFEAMVPEVRHGD